LAQFFASDLRLIVAQQFAPMSFFWRTKTLSHITATFAADNKEITNGSSVFYHL
jgi:hypothetical protein